MSLAEKVISIVAPHDCLGCGAEGRLICDWCKPDAVSIIPSRCYKCQKKTDSYAVCRSCQRKTKLKNVWVSTEYGGLAKELVQALKFQRKKSAADLIAETVAGTLPYPSSGWIVTYIPTATSRLRYRGYDHAKLIAQSVSKRLSAPCLPLLGHLGQTRQVGSKRSQRLTQLQGAFYPKHAVTFQGKAILLIDDVLTTGATLEEAALTLRRAGAKSVCAAVFAQKQ